MEILRLVFQIVVTAGRLLYTALPGSLEKDQPPNRRGIWSTEGDVQLSKE
jgi:hypothetical protein